MAPSWRWEAPEAGAHPLAAIDDAAAVLLCPMLSVAPCSPTRAGSSSRASRRAPSSYITSTGEGVDLQVSCPTFCAYT